MESARSLPEGFEIQPGNNRGNYDWEKLFNGSWHILVKGIDFDLPGRPCTPLSFRQNARSEAKKRGFRLEYAEKTEGKKVSIAIRAVPLSADDSLSAPSRKKPAPSPRKKPSRSRSVKKGSK